MENTELLKSIVILMEQTAMDDQEKTFWSVLLPGLNVDELNKFKAVLEKEVNQLKTILSSLKA